MSVKSKFDLKGNNIYYLFKYDFLGNKVKESSPNNTQGIMDIDKVQNRIDYIYDAQGKLKAKANVYNKNIFNTTTNKWEPNQVTEYENAYVYDGNNNITKEYSGANLKDSKGHISNLNDMMAKGLYKESIYNGFNKIKSITDANDRASNIESKGNKISETFVYDGYGRVVSDIRSDNKGTTYKYVDNLRKATINVQDGTVTTRVKDRV